MKTIYISASWQILILKALASLKKNPFIDFLLVSISHLVGFLDDSLLHKGGVKHLTCSLTDSFARIGIEKQWL